MPGVHETYLVNEKKERASDCESHGRNSQQLLHVARSGSMGVYKEYEIKFEGTTTDATS